MVLEPLTDDIWVCRAPLRFLGLLAIGTRMTVVRTPGGLVVHSPCAITPEVVRAVDALGRVQAIVAPNLYHHLSVGAARAAWPEATLVAPARLARKRKDLTIDHALEDGPLPAWGGALELFRVEGSMLGETLLYHRPTRSLVTADLFENFVEVDDPITRLYLKAGGVYGRPGWHPLLRVVYRDRRAAAASLEPVLALDLARIVVAHGEVVEGDANAALRTAMGFLW
jgi:hypothetical protein